MRKKTSAPCPLAFLCGVRLGQSHASQRHFQFCTVEAFTCSHQCILRLCWRASTQQLHGPRKSGRKQTCLAVVIRHLSLYATFPCFADSFIWQEQQLYGWREFDDWHSIYKLFTDNSRWAGGDFPPCFCSFQLERLLCLKPIYDNKTQETLQIQIRYFLFGLCIISTRESWMS